MFALLVLAATHLGGSKAYPDAPSNYLPLNTPFRNEAAFNGAAQHSQNYQPSTSYNQNPYLQQQYHTQAQPQYQTQSQNSLNQNNGGFTQNGGGYTSQRHQQQQNGFHTAGYADQAGFGPQSSDVYKSLYYFDSPEDVEIPAPRFRYVNEGKSSKHHKIIFIKAPGYVQQPITDIQANIGAAGGGKTIIYVLTKKPDAQQDVVINTGAAQQAVSKPEVYYIKYNSKQDAEQQISQSLNGQRGGAIEARPVGSNHEFISSIRDNIRAQGPIVKNLGGHNGGQQAPQGAQILGFNGGAFTTGAPQGYSGASSGGSSNTGYSGFSTLAPSEYSGGSTGDGFTGYSTAADNGGSFTTDSYGYPRH